MTVGERIKEARKVRGMTQRELAESAGTATGTIQQYELGKRQPRIEQLEKISRALDISVLYLLGTPNLYNGTEEAIADHQSLKREQSVDASIENILRALYGSCDLRSAAYDGFIFNIRVCGTGDDEFVIENDDFDAISCAVEGLISSLVLHLGKKSSEITEESGPAEVIRLSLPEYDQPMSAGTGQPADDDMWHDLLLKKRPPCGTSYVARISGDSMEPTYHDGDRLFIRATVDILPGQVGVFLMDGQQWVKELGDGVLISHNPAYPPRPMTDGIRCQGIVLGVCDDSYFK